MSLPIHGAVELVLGVAVMAAPFALGFGATGLVISVVFGAVIAGIALSTSPGNRGVISVATHYALDRGLAIGLLAAALLLASVEDRAAAVFFVLAASAQLALSLTTRYTATA